jgi:hypothetical protein
MLYVPHRRISNRRRPAMSLEMFILIGIILCMSIVAYDEWSKS